MGFKEKNVRHYNSISEAWPFMLGNNFHWGYFSSQNESLEKATYNLIDQMINLGKIEENSSIIDIGCGIGEPASYLSEKLNCSVIGISNSEKGIEMAIERSGNNTVKFKVADALDNKMASQTFDISWLLEMSHLIEDKKKLIEESTRVLKQGGRIVLCDLMLLRPLSAKEIFSMQKELRVMEQSFGKASLWTSSQYVSLFEELGLDSIEFVNISREVTPTIKAWEENCMINKNKILEVLDISHFNSFLNSCSTLQSLYENKTWGYGIIVGTKA